MKRDQAKAAAKRKLNNYHKAGWKFFRGKGEKPDPALYGISGSIDKVGNMISHGGHTFSIAEIQPYTGSINAGF